MAILFIGRAITRAEAITYDRRTGVIERNGYPVDPAYLDTDHPSAELEDVVGWGPYTHHLSIEDEEGYVNEHYLVTIEPRRVAAKNASAS